MYDWLRPLIFQLPPEKAHRLAIQMLKVGAITRKPIALHPRLHQSLWGMDFSHPLGLAAGFDKDGEAILPLLQQGFSFVEVGTVTRYPQPGNPGPRVFRLPEDEAIINRLGFNSEGLHAMRRALQEPREGIAGVNLGINRYTHDPPDDYAVLYRTLAPFAHYVVINVSSPNTRGLRDWQDPTKLLRILRSLHNARLQLPRHKRPVPIWLKLSPDLPYEALPTLVEIACENGIDALMISNTTLHRPASLKGRFAHEAGGLSGRPLMASSTAMLREVARHTRGAIPLIGVGGIFSGEDAYEKIRAGAHLLQLYTALIYHGFAVVKKIVEDLDRLLAADGFTHISQAVGADVYSVYQVQE